MKVACKTYTNENSAESFHKEAGNLDILKEGFRGSRRVMQHIASIVHGNEFMILLPLAEHYDLEIFLRGGRRPRADTRYYDMIYDFDETFPQLKADKTLQKAILKEMFEIAAALVWLHEELHIFGSLDRYLAHLDLKPENILITRDTPAQSSRPHHLAGKWMLTDFGVSVFDKATNEKASRVHSIRDVGPRLTSRANRDMIMRGHGPYEPPEVDLAKVDGRKCDVWSFACIMCDILAFASGRDMALLEFRSKRFDGRDDYFYRAKKSLVNRERVIDGTNTEVKPDIQNWVRGHARVTLNTWVTGYVAVLEEALVPTPSHRPSMTKIMNELEKLPHMIDSERANPDHKLAPNPQSRRPSITFSDNLGTPTGERNGFPRVPSPETNTSANTIPSNMAPAKFIRFPPTVAQEDHSKSYSSTEFPNQHLSGLASGIEVATPLAQPVPLVSTPRHPPTAHAGIEASNYEQAPTISIPSLKRKQVGIIAVTPCGDKVAFLCGSQLHVFWSDNGSEAGLIDLSSPQVSWTKMCIISTSALIYGLKSCEKIVSSVERVSRDYFAWC